MLDETTSILMVGVGGQGIVLASDVLAQAASYAGHDVKKSEVHGMSQRGGSVSSDVRFGQRVHSPRTAPGDVDYLVAFEKLEALRYLHYLAPAGTLIVNDQEILPSTVTSGAAEYPPDIIERIAARSRHVEIIPALEMARDAGNTRAANTALLGALSRHLDIPLAAWKRALTDRVPAKALDVNVEVFKAARRAKSPAAARKGQQQPARSQRKAASARTTASKGKRTTKRK
jgi:indolepyruvate ferredoxin oxidoreductase beta subunit